MAGNIFGTALTLTTFGESHGKAIGGVLDGFPSGINIDLQQVQNELNKRRPGQSSIVSQRNELDEVEFLSGLLNGITLGTPIAFIVRNTNIRPSDYNHIKNTYRPSHADYTYDVKYGIRDYRGGGRASARETIARVIGGALAKQLLQIYKIKITAYVNQIGSIGINKSYTQLNLNNINNSNVRCPDDDTSNKMISLIKSTATIGDTLGGEITCIIKNTPAGLGEPVFDKLHAKLAHAITSINAVKGFEIGLGFKSANTTGTKNNDIFTSKHGKISTITNNSGGVQGGISNGEDIYFKVAFKPVPTIMTEQQTVDILGNIVAIKGKGRHDVTVVPRAIPIVEAMTALVIADYLLINNLSKV